MQVPFLLYETTLRFRAQFESERLNRERLVIAAFQYDNGLHALLLILSNTSRKLAVLIGNCLSKDRVVFR